MPAVEDFDVVVIGGGQAGLAVGYYLRRSGLRYVIADAHAEPGGAWRSAWPSLRLFSPAQWSSLPGWLMPRSDDDYPCRDDVVEYLAAYERRFELPVRRALTIEAVEGGDGTWLSLSGMQQRTHFQWRARAVVSATGTWANPVIPSLPGSEIFHGRQLHSAAYLGPATFAGRRVVVVGGGNSGAQIVSELWRTAQVTWATLDSPVFLPDEVDGRYLFEQATARYKALLEGRTPDPPRSLGHIVVVPPVRDAREQGALARVDVFQRFTATGVEWADGRETDVDDVIWATGFRPALRHLAPLGIIQPNGRIAVSGTRAIDEPRLWLVGYGEWTGFASATLIGVGRSARATVDEIAASLATAPSSST